MDAIRGAQPTDIPELVRAYEWLFAPPGRRPIRWDVRHAAERLRFTLSSPHSTVLICHSGGEIVGFCSVYLVFESVRFGPKAWVEDLAVHPAHRSRGVGKRLLKAAKRWSRENGAIDLGLESGLARVDAHRFYEREGPTSSERSFHWDL